MKQLRRGFFLAGLISLVALSATAGDCVSQVVTRLGTAVPGDADAVLRFAADLDSNSPAAKGLFAALDALPNDGALRVRQVLTNFADAPQALFEQLSLVKHADGFDGLIVSLAKGDLEAVGSSLVLFYTTTKMNPADIARFEVPIPGSLKRADAQDVAGNLLEGKAHDWNTYSDFVAEMSFREIRQQAEVFQQYAASQSSKLILIFGHSIPPQHQALFDDILGGLVNQPNVVFINGV